MAGVSGWVARREGGQSLPARLLLRIALAGGWPAAHALLYPIVAFYLLAVPDARHASRAFLTRVLGHPAGWRDIARHLMTFADVLLDRVYLVSGRTAGYGWEVRGLDELKVVLAGGRGCLLFGAHLGSFEALRAFGHAAPVRTHALMHRGEAGGYTALLEELNPELRRDVIDLGEPDAMLRVREALQRGEMVGILADRAVREERSIAVPFLGRPALFPAGPIILASLLQAPVMLAFCERTGKRSYAILFTPFADRITLPRAQRRDALAAWVARFAATLEPIVRVAPFNWFNFYDFWNEEACDPGAGAHHAVRRGAARELA